MTRKFLSAILTPVLTAQAAAARIGVRDVSNTTALAEFAVISGNGVVRLGDGSGAIDWTLARTGVAAAQADGALDVTGTLTAPTPATADSSTKTATTAFVKAQRMSDLTLPNAAVPMNANKLTGLAAGTTAGDSVRYEQVLLLAGGTMTGAVNLASTRFSATARSTTTLLTNSSTVHQQCDTSGGAFTINLNATPTVGQLVIIEDSVGACAVNPVTIGRNGNTIGGVAADLSLNVARGAFALMYDGVSDWKVLARPEFKSAVAPLDSPAFTGSPTVPTGTAGAGGTNAASQAYVETAVTVTETGLIIPSSANLQTAMRQVEAYVQNVEERFEQHHHDERYGIQFVSTLPTEPRDGQIVHYQSAGMATLGGVVWMLRYNAASTSAYKWEFVGGSPLDSNVDGNQTTTSTTYADLGTVGPQLTVPLAGDYMLSYGCVCLGSVAGAVVKLNPHVNGVLIAEAYALYSQQAVANVDYRAMARTKKATAIAASAVVKLMYAVSAGATGAYDYRWLTVTPVRVG